MNKNKISKTALLITLVGLIFIIFTDNQNNQSTQPEDKNTTQEYTDEEIGFLFEYPSSLEVYKWHTPGFEKIKDLPQVIIVSIEEREIWADGACGSSNPETFDFEKEYLDSSFVERKFMEENQDFSYKQFTTSGIHKVIATNAGEEVLLTIRTCQGLADDEKPATTTFSINIYKDDFRVSISLRDLEGFEPEVKVKDIDNVADKLINGTYEGEMQNRLNQFVNIVKTFEWSNKE